MHSTNNEAALHKWLLLACVLYLAFIIYGSLVPLRYVALPFNDAIERFWQIPYLQLGIRSRADWVANILLFVPFAFLLCALSFRPGATAVNLLPAGVIWLFCAALAVSIEFTQLYFPQRTVSINDIIAEATGAMLGIILYCFRGRQLKQFLTSLALIRGQASVVTYLLIGYVAIFVLYNLLPLDLTLSPVELYKKWREGRIVLLPFAGYRGSAADIGYAVLSDILLWCPIAVLLYLQQQQAGIKLYGKVLLLALLLEFCQLFVYSRVTDISDVLCALIATWLSVTLLRLWQRSPASNIAGPTAKLTPWLLWPGAIVLYSLLLLMLFWYPFNFNFDWAFINQRLQAAQGKVLLESLYFGTEYRAITALLQKLLAFLPLGVLLALFQHRLSLRWQQHTVQIVGSIYVISLALLCEGMQLALPGKTVDITDAILQIGGAAAGFGFTVFFANRLHQPDSAVVNPPHAVPPGFSTPLAAKPASGLYIKLGSHLAVSMLVMFLLSRLPALPYNVRELLSDNISAIPGLCLMLYLLAMPAVLSFNSYARFILWAPLLCVTQSLVIFWLLYATVPTESLHDIVGAPVTTLPRAIELMLRFIGFFSLIQFNCMAALQFIYSRSKIPATILWLGANAAVALFWYLAVVKMAATDNIVELLADGGSLAAITALTAWLMLLFSLAAYLAQQCCTPVPTRWKYLPLLIVFGLPLSWWLLQNATESVIVKYQQAYSALQFLLSTDRTQYAAPLQLFMRYSLAFITLLGLLCWFFIPALVLRRNVKLSGSGA
ncbi:glycopeptide antibiotics resistance protein [Rheinheimera pacifica]|uniref:VanZ family protein n=1 Tax=Rheinheimera pacifica TaxID=173990 RepID=UPI00285B3F35|nr:VanZ family protein [Rheinheimera pacifica]MDR6983600.1 glycopeptide antibiotics resistance protein [Rheinheimera pacifica]